MLCHPAAVASQSVAIAQTMAATLPCPAAPPPTPTSPNRYYEALSMAQQPDASTAEHGERLTEAEEGSGAHGLALHRCGRRATSGGGGPAQPQAIKINPKPLKTQKPKNPSHRAKWPQGRL